MSRAAVKIEMRPAPRYIWGMEKLITYLQRIFLKPLPEPVERSPHRSGPKISY
ncbi:hypothetical protein [Salipiger bermudensis]